MPSPIKFKMFDNESETIVEVNGYCNRRKDSLAIYKKADGSWSIIHKASGLQANAMRPPSVQKYPALLALCAYVQENASEPLAIIDELPMRPAVMHPEQQAALARILEVGKAFKS